MSSAEAIVLVFHKRADSGPAFRCWNPNVESFRCSPVAILVQVLTRLARVARIAIAAFPVRGRLMPPRHFCNEEASCSTECYEASCSEDVLSASCLFWGRYERRTCGERATTCKWCQFCAGSRRRVVGIEQARFESKSHQSWCSPQR